MKAAIFVEPGRIVLDEKAIPDIGLSTHLSESPLRRFAELTFIFSKASIQWPTA